MTKAARESRYTQIATIMVEVVKEAQDKGQNLWYVSELTTAVNAKLKAISGDDGDVVSEGMILKLRHRATMVSKKLYKGQSMQWTYLLGYRITDRQTAGEMRAARGKFRASATLEEEGLARIDVKHAGPEAREIIGLTKASASINAARAELLDQMCSFEPGDPVSDAAN